MARGVTLPAAPMQDRARRLMEARVRLGGDLGASKAAMDGARDEFDEAAMRHYLGESDDAALKAAEDQLAEAERHARVLDGALRALRARVPGP